MPEGQDALECARLSGTLYRATEAGILLIGLRSGAGPGGSIPAGRRGLDVAGRGIPVVMYHSVGRDRPDWIWNHLITPVDVFEAQMRALRQEHWETISLGALHAHMLDGTPVPGKAVVLTFDDGYLDNWVYAYPILKKYGHRAVIWMTTDFASPRPRPSLTLDDVWAGLVGEDRLVERGFLSWHEMRAMAGSGHVEIQSHAKTHTWYPSGPRVLDFHRPRGLDGYETPPWLVWNRFPERKSETLTVRMDDEIPYGTPIYEHGKSLVVRRYFEDGRLTRRLQDVVSSSGGAAFFQAPGWRDRLVRAVDEYGPREERTETEVEYAERVRVELSESKREIEEQLGTKVEYLCWPGGGHNKTTLDMAHRLGYVATTAHYEDPTRRNRFGDDPRQINRIGSGSPCVWRGLLFRRTDPEFFIAGLEYFAGDKKSLWKLRALKLKYLLRYQLRGE